MNGCAHAKYYVNMRVTRCLDCGHDVSDKEKYMGEKYRALPKEDRWLESPFEIGGHSFDVSQVGYCFRHKIREMWPINKVPEHIASEVDKLTETLEAAEKAIEDFIELVSEEVAAENGRE